MKTIIIEDELSSQRLLSHIIKDYLLDFELKGCATSIKMASELFERIKPDLIFLDIELGDDMSANFVESLDRFDCKIIFTTAHNEYAINVFENEAFDYLLKPYSPDQVIKAIVKANRINQKEFSFKRLRSILKHKLNHY